MSGRRYQDGEVVRYGAGESWRPNNPERRARSPPRERERARTPLRERERERERARSPFRGRPRSSAQDDRYIPRRRSRSADRFARRDRSRGGERGGDSWRRDRSRSPRRSPPRRTSPRRGRFSPRRDNRDERDSKDPRDRGDRLRSPPRARSATSFVPGSSSNPNAVPVSNRRLASSSISDNVGRPSGCSDMSYVAQSNFTERSPFFSSDFIFTSPSARRGGHTRGRGFGRGRGVTPSGFHDLPAHNSNFTPIVNNRLDPAIRDDGGRAAASGQFLSPRLRPISDHISKSPRKLADTNKESAMSNGFTPPSPHPPQLLRDAELSRGFGRGRGRGFSRGRVRGNGRLSGRYDDARINSSLSFESSTHDEYSQAPNINDSGRSRSPNGRAGVRSRRLSPPPPRASTYRRPRSPSKDRRDDRYGPYRRPSPPRDSAVSSAAPSRETSRRSSPRPTSTRHEGRPVHHSPIPSRPRSRSSHGTSVKDRSPPRAPAEPATIRSPPRGPAALSRMPPTGPRDAREPRDLRESREPREPRESRAPRDLRESREPLRESREARELRDSRNSGEARDVHSYPVQPSTAIAPPARPAQAPAAVTNRQDLTSPGAPPSGPRGYIPPRGGYGRGRGGWGNTIQGRNNIPPSSGPVSATTGTNNIPTGPRHAPASSSVPSTPVAQSKPFNPPKGPAADASKRPSLAESLLAALPALIPGGKIDPELRAINKGISPELEAQYDQHVSDAEKVRLELWASQEKTRKMLAEWEKTERENQIVELRSNLAEQSLAKLSGQAGGAAF